jgi:uncharacterized protein (DUF1800 family)
MANEDLALMGHLMRRAGFGATRDELETYAARGYESVVDDLLNPERFPPVDEDLIQRYYDSKENPILAAGVWIYRMVNTKRHLEEKMSLFWHQVFATSQFKVKHTRSLVGQIKMFRSFGLSNMRTLLTELSEDPAMIFFLDNHTNLKEEPNENYGRELLELFSMGVGNYSEEDIKMAARAFTGWTVTQPIPVYPQGGHPAEFVYREEEHDDSVKTFLGETGRFNGGDIVDIVARQPATAKFVSRHLYNYFVADEPQVPSWHDLPPHDPDAIDALSKAYTDSGGDLRAIMRVLLNSDFFKEARFKKVKSPAELVAGIIKLVGTHKTPEAGITEYSTATAVMGQELLNPPTVEGWHTGKEWIDGGILGERVNFAADQVGDVTKPGVRSMVDRIAASGSSLSPDETVAACLDILGPVEPGDETRAALLRHATSAGTLRFDNEEEREKSSAQIVRMLQLVVASREFQFA